MSGPITHDPVVIHLGGQTRHLMFTPRAMKVAQRLLSGKSPRLAIAEGRGEDVIFNLAACGLMHELKDKCDPARVEKWIELELKKYPELDDAVCEAARRYYVAAGVIDEDDAPGGAQAPSSNPSTNTAP